MTLDDIEYIASVYRRWNLYLPNRPVDPYLCWNWTGCLSHGYGVLGVKLRGQNRTIRISRLAVLLEDGEIADDLCALHQCDNGWCGRRSHIWMGTMVENLADMRAKGRGRPGVRTNAKLCVAKVIELRTLYAQGGYSVRELAERFGVGQSTADSAIVGRQWKHVPDPVPRRRPRKAL